MEPRKADSDDANAMLLGGAAIAAIGVVGAVASGAVCPVCIVAVPVLVGIGVARKVRARRRAGAEETNDSSVLRDRRSP